jgi:hypothetical protein
LRRAVAIQGGPRKFALPARLVLGIFHLEDRFVNHRMLWPLAAMLGFGILSLFVWNQHAPARPEKPADPLASPVTEKATIPVQHVVLFNTGIAYFERRGEVNGKQRLELTFPSGNLNDLLKSMTVDDGGTPGAIGYDGGDPVEQALKSFAVDLTGNPTLGQILNQSRGERVEVTLDSQAAGTNVFTGSIVGMEAAPAGDNKESHSLNLLAADGMRRIALDKVQRVRFLDPEREREFRRALGMLASGSNGQRRRVWAELRGEGKRAVKVGYVLEAPIWKATYRLNLDAKPTLEARAIVENTTDEDWTDIRVTLMAGRPITFEMDLSKPLFVPRPAQQPEFYASLTPPTYTSQALDEADPMNPTRQRPGVQLGNFGTQIGNLGGQFGQIGGLGALGNSPTRMPHVQGTTMPTSFHTGLLNRYQIAPEPMESTRLTYAELVARREAMIRQRQAIKNVPLQQSGRDEIIENLAVDSSRIGDGFRQDLPGKFTVPRQTAVMLPLLKTPLSVERFSVFNRSVHPRFAMHTLQVKNTSEQPLLQGPVSVHDAGVFVGDCKIPDMAINEERWLSYAMDLGIEVRTERGEVEPTRPEIWIHKGQLVTVEKQRRQTYFSLVSRAKTPRKVIVEHPVEGNWTPTGAVLPRESTASHHRYEFTAAANTTTRGTVEEQSRSQPTYVAVASVKPETWTALLKAEPAPSPAMKAAIEKVVETLDKTRIAQDKAREAKGHHDALAAELKLLRQRIDKLPEKSAARERLSKEYTQQEEQLDKFLKAMREAGDAALKAERERDTIFTALSAK